MNNKKKAKAKILSLGSWIGFSLILGAGVVGIGFGVNNFIKSDNEIKGTGYSETLKTKLQLALNNDSAKTENEYFNEAENIGKKFINIANSLNANEIQVQSGISKSNKFETNGSWLTIADIYLYTNKNLTNFELDFSNDKDLTSAELQDKKGKLDYEKLKIYLTVAQNNIYKLVNVNLSNDSNLNTVNFTNSYQLNNLDSEGNVLTKAYIGDNRKMLFPLREREKDNNTDERWDLSFFQKQFTEVYQWDGSNEKTRHEIVDENKNNDNDDNNNDDDNTNNQINNQKAPPNQTYIFWKNRNGLVNFLQSLATIGYLYKSKSSFDAVSQRRINGLYNQICNFEDWKSFMDWIKDPLSGYTWIDVMSILYKSLKSDYDISQDPLIELLNSYYLYTKEFKNENEFLYSWNFKDNTFLNSYLQPIDYDNWFDYFVENSTSSQKEDEEYQKEYYYSDEFNVNWEPPNFGAQSVANTVKLVNESAITNSFINYDLLKLIENNNSNPINVYNNYFDFIDQTVSLMPSVAKSPIIGNNSFNGVLISLSVVLLIIGIVVSILYRIPGLLASFSMFVSFCLSFLMISNLSITFTTSSIFAFISILASSLVPFLYGIKQMQTSIREKKLNINNSFKSFLSSFIWMSILINLSLFISSLVLLFFGNFELRTFGTTLTVVSLNNIIFNFAYFLILDLFIYLLALKIWPNLMLKKDDLIAISKIKNVTSFYDGDEQSSVLINSFGYKFSNKFAKSLLNKKWSSWIISASLFTIGFIGVILLVTIDKKHYFAFSYSNQIMLTFDSSQNNVAYKIADEIAKNLNISWKNTILVNNVFENSNQLILVPSKSLNPNDVYTSLTNITNINNLSEWINNLSFRSNDAYYANSIVSNSLKCSLISLGFLLLFYLLMLNVINVIPIFITSIASNFIALGIIGIIQIPISLNIVESMLSTFLFNQILITFIFGYLKINYVTRKTSNYYEINNFSWERTKNIYLFLSIVVSQYILINLVLMFFDTRSNLNNYGISIITIIVSYIFDIYFISAIFSLFCYLRELYLQRANVSNDNESKYKKYDKVDEQIIYEINN